MTREMAKYGSYTLPGTQMEKSAIFVPIWWRATRRAD